MYCEKCGTKQNPGSAFCRVCGAPQQVGQETNDFQKQDTRGENIQQEGYPAYMPAPAGSLKPYPGRKALFWAKIFCILSVLAFILYKIHIYRLRFSDTPAPMSYYSYLIRNILLFAVWIVPLFLLTFFAKRTPILHYIAAGGLGINLLLEIYYSINRIPLALKEPGSYVDYPDLYRYSSLAVILLGILWYALMTVLMFSTVRRPDNTHKLAIILIVVMSLMVVGGMVKSYANLGSSFRFFKYGVFWTLRYDHLLYATLAAVFYTRFRAKEAKEFETNSLEDTDTYEEKSKING